jgi:hypothetical protein
MKKLNFKAVPTRDIEGNLEPRDISKELGNYIYRETSDLGELDLAQRIYKDGEVEANESEIEIIRKYIDSGYKAFVKKAFEEIVSDVQEVQPL